LQNPEGVALDFEAKFYFVALHTLLVKNQATAKIKRIIQRGGEAKIEANYAQRRGRF
jgi:hypothetical protein